MNLFSCFEKITGFFCTMVLTLIGAILVYLGWLNALPVFPPAKESEMASPLIRFLIFGVMGIPLLICAVGTLYKTFKGTLFCSPVKPGSPLKFCSDEEKNLIIYIFFLLGGTFVVSTLGLIMVTINLINSNFSSFEIGRGAQVVVVCLAGMAGSPYFSLGILKTLRR